MVFRVNWAEFYSALFIVLKMIPAYLIFCAEQLNKIDSVKYHEAINYAIDSNTEILSYELFIRKKTRNNKLYLIRKSLSNKMQSLLLASLIAVLLK